MTKRLHQIPVFFFLGTQLQNSSERRVLINKRLQIAHKLRGHLKISHIAEKRKNFHIGGVGLDPIRRAIDSIKKNEKKREKKKPVVPWCLQRQISKKVLQVVFDLPGSRCTYADASRGPGGSPSIAKLTSRQSQTVKEEYDFYFYFLFRMLKSGRRCKSTE